MAKASILTDQNISQLCKQFLSIKVAYFIVSNTGLKEKCSSKKTFADTFASCDQYIFILFYKTAFCMLEY